MKPLAFNYSEFTDLEADYLILQAENAQLKARLGELRCREDCRHHEDKRHKCAECVRNVRRFDYYEARK